MKEIKNIYFDGLKIINKDVQYTKQLIFQQRQEWRLYKTYLEEELIREIKKRLVFILHIL